MQENKFTINKQYDLHKEDDVRAILEQGNAEEIERLRRHSSLSREQIERLRYYALLRQGVHQQMQQKLELRIKNNPQASQQEIEMGCYLENIEP
ncbi:MAG: hypothetical protein COX77_04510, partial [Candidatus Komeilibacteria bacterium CG_4_10_14_0_2_um_filter_37_10]